MKTEIPINPNDNSTRVLEKQMCGYVFACILMIFSGLSAIDSMVFILSKKNFIFFNYCILQLWHLRVILV